MKAFRATLGLLFLSMLVFHNGMAQKAKYTSPGGLSIGFGSGYSYQTSDLANSRGMGFDFILGSRIYQRENAFLSVDWKFRFLAGGNTAYDHRINPDDTYSNIRYRFFTYDLELDLTLNRLRERTGIILTGFAGAGITHGRTFTDLYDAGGSAYDFSGIDPNRDRKLVYQDLLALSDGDFETRLVNKAALLPTAGLFLGYQISRSFIIGIEYKTNFYLSEENSFAGIDLDNRALSGSGMDRNNYVSLGFRWRLGGGSSRGRSAGNYSSGGTTQYSGTTNSGNMVVAASPMRPSVRITDPSAESVHTGSPVHTVKATIQNVSGPEHISFFQNGYPNNNFTYNANTLAFVASVRLREGENNIRIMATNQQSSAEDQATIILDNPGAVNAAPEVEFTTPAEDRITSSSARIDVTASVKNISSKQGIQLTLNGSNTPFEYYPVSGTVKTSVVLADDDNTLLIKGFNESGSAQDQLTIRKNLSAELELPTVRFTNPVVPVEVVNNRFPLSAVVEHVSRRNDVQVSMNGTDIYNFLFDPNGRVTVSLLLPEGINTLEITARNEAGSASESTSIAYRRPGNDQVVYITPVITDPGYNDPVRNDPVRNDPVRNDPVNMLTPPVINILSPAANPFTTYESSEELRATVLNVSSKENITLNVNGSAIRNFSYSSSTKILTANLALRDGRNLVTLGAQNESGGDAKEVVLNKENRPCREPVIRLIDPAGGQISTDQQIYALKAEVRNAHSSQLSLTANGKPLSFSYDNNMLLASVPLAGGTNVLSLNVSNNCGEDQASARITYNPTVTVTPCTPPTVSFTLQEVKRNDATHELRGSVTGVNSKSGISLALDGRTQNGFQFTPSTGNLSASFKLTPGSHTVLVSATNECGTDSKSGSVSVQEEVVVEEACGIRFNPGNADWQFCLVTPSGTYSRANLSNANFSYSGPARSLYFMPIGGGGTATVNGRPYAIKSGQYYLFSGNLNVNISTSNPGSMGHWSVCITSGSAPVSGNGNNRPKSPCEEDSEDSIRGQGNRTRR